MERDVTDMYTVATIRRHSLAVIKKGETSDLPEDNFFVNFKVSAGTIVLTTGANESKSEFDVPENLDKLKKADLIDIIQAF